jgi:hypothetical protein
MRQTILTAAVAFVGGGIATGAVLSSAQPPAPPAQVMPGGPPPPPPPHPWMGWGHRPGAGMAGHGMQGGPVGGMRALALVYRQQDRALSPADVQKIAEAFLLWNGNHTWKVADVAATSDGRVGFSLTTAEGSLIAKFTMDPHTARIVRVG